MNKELRQHFEKLIPLTDQEFNYVLSHFTSKKLKKHQFLIQEGDNVINDYFVVKGLLKAYHVDISGKEYIMQFAMEDWWISDYQAYLSQTNATLNVDCIEDVELLCLSLYNRDKICADLHKIEHFFRRNSNAGYVALQRRLLSLLRNNAEETAFLAISNPISKSSQNFNSFLSWRFQRNFKSFYFIVIYLTKYL